jgi:glyoxylase-like metal-dependent hydrolase (beta-lactamase superfamily II)
MPRIVEPGRRVFPVRLPFALPIREGVEAQRFVITYIVVGERGACVVDTGAAGSQEHLVRALQELGLTPADVRLVVNTHEHGDHIGGNAFFEEWAHPEFACHEAAVRWIEDLEAQQRERPIYQFERLVNRSVRITRVLHDGDEIDLGGTTLRVIFTPGHSPGSISLFCPEEGVLITADALQPVGGLPLYMDPRKAVESLRRLAGLPGVRVLYNSHREEPLTGPDIPRALEESIHYIERVGELAEEARRRLGEGAAPEEVTREVLLALGLNPPPVMPLTIISVTSHFR